MNTKTKMLLLFIFSILTIIIAISIGTVYVSPKEIANILSSSLLNTKTSVSDIKVSIIYEMRVPRVVLAFLVGGVLSVSGSVMQAVLKNPLASTYTLGVSSGGAFFVAVYMFLGLSNVVGIFTLPIVGLIGGIVTVVIAVTFSAKIDKSMSNNTIILVGMVFSLFINAMLTVISSLSYDTFEKMIRWQMGSFALKDKTFIYAILPFYILGIIILMLHSKEMDNLSFGEEQASSVGINVKRIKWLLLFVSASLAGISVALVGIIGFVDLVVPHIIRKVFGSKNSVVTPATALLGGSFLVISDLIARTIVSPQELPIGAVTAVIGAPFFMYIYFKKGEN